MCNYRGGAQGSVWRGFLQTMLVVSAISAANGGLWLGRRAERGAGAGRVPGRLFAGCHDVWPDRDPRRGRPARLLACARLQWSAAADRRLPTATCLVNSCSLRWPQPVSSRRPAAGPGPTVRAVYGETGGWLWAVARHVCWWGSCKARFCRAPPSPALLHSLGCGSVCNPAHHLPQALRPAARHPGPNSALWPGTALLPPRSSPLLLSVRLRLPRLPFNSRQPPLCIPPFDQPTHRDTHKTHFGRNQALIAACFFLPAQHDDAIMDSTHSLMLELLGNRTLSGCTAAGTMFVTTNSANGATLRAASARLGQG